jgi:hypothetical protein
MSIERRVMSIGIDRMIITSIERPSLFEIPIINNQFKLISLLDFFIS